MTRTQQILTGVLVLQIALAVFMLWPEPARAAGAPLFGDLTADQVQGFTVFDTAGNQADVERSGDTWVIADSDGFPADSEAINTDLENLLLVSSGRTVTKTKDSHDRLQVSDDEYMRKVVVRDTTGGEHTLFIGSTVGAGATHVRLDGSDEVFLTDKITSYDFGSEPRNWIETTYVVITREQMNKMTLQNANGTFEFTREGVEGDEENWVMAGLKEGETFNPNNLVSLLTRLTALQLKTPLGKTALPEYGMDEPQAVVTLDYTAEDGTAQQLVLTIGALDETDDTVYVKASTSEYYVKISSYALSDFVERAREVFLQTDAAE